MKRWARLILYLGGIWVFIKVTPQVLNKVKIYREIIKSSDAHGIDNSTLFYSEEPATFDAENQIRENLDSKRTN